MKAWEDYERNLQKYVWFQNLEDKDTQDTLVTAAFGTHSIRDVRLLNPLVLILHKLTEKLCEMEDLGKTEKAE